MIKRVDYDYAIRSRGGCYILKGKNVSKINGRVTKMKMIKEQYPLPFERINNTIHQFFKGIDYINFWHGVEIYKIQEELC